MADLSALSTCPLDKVWTTGHFGRPGDVGLTLERTTPLSIVQISLFPQSTSKAQTKLKKLGFKELPSDGEMLPGQKTNILSLGAGRYLLESNKADLHAKVQKALPAELGSVTDLSSARVAFTLTGKAVETVLQKGIAIDFCLNAFPIGRVAQTTAHHLNVTVVREDTAQFRIFAFSTFARSAFDWLDISAQPHGLERL